MPMPINSKLDICCKLDISHNVSTFKSIASKKQAEVLPHQAFISRLFSNNGSILTPSMISHS